MLSATHKLLRGSAAMVACKPKSEMGAIKQMKTTRNGMYLCLIGVALITSALLASPHSATAQQLNAPADEASFYNVVTNATQGYGQAQNDMQKGALRHARSVAICKTIRSTHVTWWAGAISVLDATDKGNGILVVTLNDKITLGTDNNEFSNAINNTVIPVGSPLFQKVSAMKVGDPVWFSGDFLRSDTDCFQEQSLTTDGSMQQPEFLFRFSDVKAATTN